MRTSTKERFVGEQLPDIPLKNYRYMNLEWSYDKLEGYFGEFTLKEVKELISKGEIPPFDDNYQALFGNEIKDDSTKYETYRAMIMEDVEEGTWHSSTVMLPYSIVKLFSDTRRAEEDAKKLSDKLEGCSDWYLGFFISKFLDNLPNNIKGLEDRYQRKKFDDYFSVGEPDY